MAKSLEIGESIGPSSMATTSGLGLTPFQRRSPWNDDADLLARAEALRHGDFVGPPLELEDDHAGLRHAFGDDDVDCPAHLFLLEAEQVGLLPWHAVLSRPRVQRGVEGLRAAGRTGTAAACRAAPFGGGPRGDCGARCGARGAILIVLFPLLLGGHPRGAAPGGVGDCLCLLSLVGRTSGTACMDRADDLRAFPYAGAVQVQGEIYLSSEVVNLRRSDAAAAQPRGHLRGLAVRLRSLRCTELRPHGVTRGLLRLWLTCWLGVIWQARGL
mmetsp:Transcript_140361/g.349925  ORF Transcript_140361/g.349925 Transcript_140361/m.349925 type:complete len:271 (+) Transcript_140361:267-1079(+)